MNVICVGFSFLFAFLVLFSNQLHDAVTAQILYMGAVIGVIGVVHAL